MNDPGDLDRRAAAEGAWTAGDRPGPGPYGIPQQFPSLTSQYTPRWFTGRELPRVAEPRRAWVSRAWAWCREQVFAVWWRFYGDSR